MAIERECCLGAGVGAGDKKSSLTKDIVIYIGYSGRKECTSKAG